MKRPDLQLNLFEVPLPDKPFGLWIRALAQAETLNPFERLWEDASTGSRRAILIKPTADTSTYAEEFIASKDLPPFLVQALLEQGLQSTLHKSGKEIERTLTSFVAFDAEDTVTTSEKFLELRKGVEFRSDYISFERRHTFGFFASLKVRLRFTIDLSDTKLAEAAKGREVYVEDGGTHHRRVLLAVDASAKTARLFDQQTDQTQDVSISTIRVPAARPILASYCQSLGKSSQLTSQLIHQAQEASFRLTRSGSKNRSWLKNELEFVRAWLLRASPGGRLVFPLPNTTQDVYLSAMPATARFTEQ